MKFKILLTALMVTMISLTVSSDASAHPWRYRNGGWRHHRVAVLVPPIPVPAPRVLVNPGYYGGGYYAPGYRAPRYRNYDGCYGNRYNDRAYYGRGRGYGQRYRNNGYNYGPRGHHYRR